MTEFVLSSPVQTHLLARFLAERVKPGDCLALWGEMGAGKTTFARAFIRALAENPALEVPSPSFALVQPYETASGTVFHYDLWRLGGPDSLHELAWDDACEAIMLVEWPERAGDFLPETALNLHFAHDMTGAGGEARRLLHLTGPGANALLADPAFAALGEKLRDGDGDLGERS